MLKSLDLRLFRCSNDLTSSFGTTFLLANSWSSFFRFPSSWFVSAWRRSKQRNRFRWRSSKEASRRWSGPAANDREDFWKKYLDVIIKVRHSAIVWRPFLNTMTNTAQNSTINGQSCNGMHGIQTRDLGIVGPYEYTKLWLPLCFPVFPLIFPNKLRVQNDGKKYL